MIKYTLTEKTIAGIKYISQRLNPVRSLAELLADAAHNPRNEYRLKTYEEILEQGRKKSSRRKKIEDYTGINGLDISGS
jgi:hypothetical protein